MILHAKKIHTLLLEKTDKKLQELHRVIKANGKLTLEKNNESDLFLHLAKTATGQQLSKQAASTIWKRVHDTANSRNSKLIDFCIDKNTEDLRQCGLSRNKIKALIGLAKAFHNNQISAPMLKKLDYDAMVAEITKLWGFGAWSADMTALFFFCKPDVWSLGDAALKRGITKLANTDNVKESVILDTVSPYKSYLALHIWKAIDTKVL